jgi:predicted CXXCH cytochrome family protein
MKRLVLIAVGCASLFVAAPAAADNGPHMKGAGLVPDTCAACHRAHTAQAPYLLKEDQESLCFTCHGSAATGSKLDVEDGVGYSGPGHTGTQGALRGGGFKYALIDTSHPEPNYNPETGRLDSATIPVLSEGEGVNSTHSVNDSEQTAWGNGSISATVNYGKGIDLACGSCHDPHGNGNYRILRPIPNESGAETGVTIADTSTKVYTTANYWASWDENAPQFQYQVSDWCTTCHTRYLAGSKSYKTDSGDAVYTYRHRSSYTQAEYESHPPPSARPNCVQCHVAHGSNSSMGENSRSVTFPDGSPGGTDSRLLRLDNRGVCQTCHHK